jgi:hypothetical protein
MSDYDYRSTQVDVLQPYSEFLNMSLKMKKKIERGVQVIAIRPLWSSNGIGGFDIVFDDGSLIQIFARIVDTPETANEPSVPFQNDITMRAEEYDDWSESSNLVSEAVSPSVEIKMTDMSDFSPPGELFPEFLYRTKRRPPHSRWYGKHRHRHQPRYVRPLSYFPVAPVLYL